MPFCMQCGAENPESAHFCDQCGSKLMSVASQATQPSTGAIGMDGHSCHQCGAATIPGEAFCDTCGAPLFRPISSGPNPIPSPPPQPIPIPHIPPAPPPPNAMPMSAPPSPNRGTSSPRRFHSTLASVQLQVLKTHATITLPAATQALLGRADPVSNFMPDVDLEPYSALEQGVGRRHLRLFLHHGQLFVEDLDSTNGSFINGTRLVAHTPQQLHNGDTLTLGKLALHVHV